jgi:hypothetical protein
MSQAQIGKNSWALETNTGFGSLPIVNLPGAGASGLFLTSIDGTTFFGLGADASYFAADNLAIKIGAGFTSFDGDNITSIKLGLKYYVNGSIPFGAEYVSFSSDGNSSDFVGLQGGYALSLSDKVYIEPGLRYNIGLDEFDEDFLQLNVGFVVFLRKN